MMLILTDIEGQTLTKRCSHIPVSDGTKYLNKFALKRFMLKYQFSIYIFTKMDGQTDRRTERQMDRWTDKKTSGRTYGQKDKCMDGPMG
jgi:hypothetical protein